MLLYKFVPTRAIAKQVAKGVFRFYELTKYRKIEEDTGRSDSTEGSITFPESEVMDAVNSLPIASLNGIEFHCSSISLSDEYLKQYFVFCVSTERSESAIDGCDYMVELDTDMFDCFETLLPRPQEIDSSNDGVKFFSHAPIEYYDIQNHPTSIEGENWKEVYAKHSSFAYQREYRATLFISDFFFNRVGVKPDIYATAIPDINGERMEFDMKIAVQSGIDDAGWRYIEIDISEFQANILSETPEIIKLSK